MRAPRASHQHVLGHDGALGGNQGAADIAGALTQLRGDTVAPQDASLSIQTKRTERDVLRVHRNETDQDYSADFRTIFRTFHATGGIVHREPSETPRS